MGFMCGVHNDGFKVVVSFENDQHNGVSESSSELFTEARDIWDRDEDIFIDF